MDDRDRDYMEDIDRYRYTYKYTYISGAFVGLTVGPGSESRADKLNILGNNSKLKQAGDDLQGLFQPDCGSGTAVCNSRGRQGRMALLSLARQSPCRGFAWQCPKSY